MQKVSGEAKYGQKLKEIILYGIVSLSVTFRQSQDLVSVCTSQLDDVV